ncbi:cytochrome c1 [Amorphus orientalis]|uniref:Cytochrome c1 n=1 Tax=Amorphus orientalis TaxID=649198 RepID=A0AAE4ASU5_9HYPH|nr:cytochrome c1 [Amorphus orientalis]
MSLRSAAFLAAGLLGAVLTAPTAMAAGEAPHIPKERWSFSGPFGQYDPAQLQRGFKIYQQSCSACHSLQYVAIRTLGAATGPDFPEAAVREIAAGYQVEDGPNDDGEMFMRPARPSDHFPPPFPNEETARLANGGAYPPDLSLIAKARAAHAGFPWFVFDAFTQYQEAGPDYVHALLTHYEEAPEDVELAPGMYYNTAFLAGNQIAMPPPLSDGQIEYTDGTPETVDQYARDVAAFLMWTAEPKLEERKQIGFRVMLFLVVFAALLYFTKRKIWSNVAH